MSAIASQIISASIICSNVCSGADQIKYETSTSLTSVRGIHRWSVNSHHKGPVTRKMFLFDDVIMAKLFCFPCVLPEEKWKCWCAQHRKHFPFYWPCVKNYSVVTWTSCLGVSNYRQLHFLCSRLSRKTSVKTSEIRITGPLWTESTSDLSIPHKGALKGKACPCYDVIMHWIRVIQGHAWSISIKWNIYIYICPKKVFTDRRTGTQLSLLFRSRFDFSYEIEMVLSESIWDH